MSLIGAGTDCCGEGLRGEALILQETGSTVVLKERGAPVKGQVCDRESCFHSLHRALFEVRTGSGQKKNNLEAVRRFQKSSQSHMTYMKIH